MTQKVKVEYTARHIMVRSRRPVNCVCGHLNAFKLRHYKLFAFSEIRRSKPEADTLSGMLLRRINQVKLTCYTPKTSLMSRNCVQVEEKVT